MDPLLTLSVRAQEEVCAEELRVDAKVKSAVKSAGNLNRLDTVSYTHLTLPTILLV